MSTSEENKALFLRYQDALRNPDALDEVLSADFVAHDLPEGQRDCAALRNFRQRVNRHVPNQTVVVELDFMIAEGDMVAAHATTTQTTPEGGQVVFSLMEVVGVRDGKIAWRCVMVDSKGCEMLQRVYAQQRQAS